MLPEGDISSAFIRNSLVNGKLHILRKVLTPRQLAWSGKIICSAETNSCVSKSVQFYHIPTFEIKFTHVMKHVNALMQLISNCFIFAHATMILKD